MSRSLPGSAIPVMFTEVSFPRARRPCGRWVVRLQGGHRRWPVCAWMVLVSPSPGASSDAPRTRRWPGAG